MAKRCAARVRRGARSFKRNPDASHFKSNLGIELRLRLSVERKPRRGRPSVTCRVGDLTFVCGLAFHETVGAAADTLAGLAHTRRGLAAASDSAGALRCGAPRQQQQHQRRRPHSDTSVLVSCFRQCTLAVRFVSTLGAPRLKASWATTGSSAERCRRDLPTCAGFRH